MPSRIERNHQIQHPCWFDLVVLPETANACHFTAYLSMHCNAKNDLDSFLVSGFLVSIIFSSSLACSCIYPHRDTCSDGSTFVCLEGFEVDPCCLNIPNTCLYGYLNSMPLHKARCHLHVSRHYLCYSAVS